MNDLAFLSSVSTAVTTALHVPATLAFFLFLKHMTLIPILGPFFPSFLPPTLSPTPHSSLEHRLAIASHVGLS